MFWVGFFFYLNRKDLSLQTVAQLVSHLTNQLAFSFPSFLFKHLDVLSLSLPVIGVVAVSVNQKLTGQEKRMLLERQVVWDEQWKCGELVKLTC